MTFFEITTATAFLLFAETPADYLLLETGMGGTYDTTNVVEHPLGTIITPIDLDHQGFLGDTIAEIAVNKAGILKRGARAVMGLQRDEGRKVLERAAHRLAIKPIWQGEDFHGQEEDGRFVYSDENGLLDLPPPALLGAHQFDNAALAIAATRHFELPVNAEALALGLRNVVWPARMTRLQTGPLHDLLPAGAELWLDGIHNAHGAKAVAETLRALQRSRPAPLVLVMGLMSTRAPQAVLSSFAGMVDKIFTLTIPGEANAHKAAFIAAEARKSGFDASPRRSVEAALRDAAAWGDARVLICGSLYLAGDVLARNRTPPD